jgi:hypothetical protein
MLGVVVTRSLPIALGFALLGAWACGSSRSSHEGGVRAGNGGGAALAGDGGMGGAGTAGQAGSSAMSGASNLGSSGGSAGYGTSGGAGTPSGGRGGASAGAAGLGDSVCPGVDPVVLKNMSCRTAADCGGGQCIWTPPPPATGCGPTGPVVLDECLNDAACQSGYVCDEGIRASGCNPSLLCMLPCNMRTCDENYRCGDDGHCVPELCPDEFTCSSEYVCAPMDSMADVHGCKVARCEDGYVCPDGSVCQALNSDRHGCAPLPCATGDYACPAGKHCSPNGQYFDHGCLADCSTSGCTPAGEQECGSDEECHVKTCATDPDCGCGICVAGKCKGSLGMCYQGTGGTSG